MKPLTYGSITENMFSYSSTKTVEAESRNKVLLVIPHSPENPLDVKVKNFQMHPDVSVVKRTLLLKRFFQKIIFVTGSRASVNFEKPILFDDIEYRTISSKKLLGGFVNPFYITFVVVLMSYIIKHYPNLIVLNFIGGTTGVLAIIISRIFRVKAITYFTGVPEASFRYRRKIRINFQLLLLFSSRIIVNNTSVKRRLRHFHWKREIKIVPNFVEENFKPLGLPREEKTVLYVGRLDENKRLSHLIRSFHRLKKKHKDEEIQLYVIGEGPEFHNLSHLSKKLDMSKFICFLGRKEHEEMPFWMNRCRVLVLPSLYEGFPNVLIEAMACGTPVICMDLPYARYVVGRAGLLVPPHSINKLAGAMERILYDDKLWQELSQKALDQASIYTIDRYVSNIRGVFGPPPE